MDISDHSFGLSYSQKFQKRLFDVIISAVGLFFFWWLILIAWLLASLDTRSNGFFIQQRVGRYGHLFNVLKIKTMRPDILYTTNVTRRGDPRITKIGAILRKTKVDELPQLINILAGHMSFVGPRPDVAGYADELKGEDRVILSVRPGITGPATLKYRNEEELLAEHDDPESYNRDFIWPDKVAINCEYVRNWSLVGDLKYIWKTLIF